MDYWHLLQSCCWSDPESAAVVAHHHSRPSVWAQAAGDSAGFGAAGLLCVWYTGEGERESKRERCVCVDVSMDERRRVEIKVGWKQGKIIRTQSKKEQEREQKWRAGHRGERVGEEHWRLIDVHILYRRAGNIILLKRSAHKHTRAADTESCCSPIQ